MTERKKITKKVRRSGRYASNDARMVRIRTESHGLGIFKTLIVFLAIALQLGILATLYFRFLFAFRWYMVVSLVLSLISCLHVLSSNRNGQSKAVWIFFLLVGFTVGYIVYYVSDVRVFFGRAKKRYARIFSVTEKYKAEKSHIECDKSTALSMNFLESAGDVGAYDGTDVEYFPSGASFYDDVLERIERAEKFVFIEYFIIADGVLLNRFLDVLERKAAEGVDVRMMYDDLGSNRTLRRKTKKRIVRSGIKLTGFNRLTPRFTVAMNFRDHRKIVVVDGKTAYTGGSNLADEYINEKRMYGYWKDTGLRLDGKAVDVFTLMFLRQWEYVTKEKPDYEKYLGLYTPTENTSAVVPYADGLDYKEPIGKGVYESMIASARERIWIMTPYFVPDDTITDLLAEKARAGVDVRLILPAIADKPYVYAVSRDNAERLIPYGVKVYTMDNSFVHSKLLLTENNVVVGSINMDLRSFYQQFECAVFTNDPKAVAQVADDFAVTFGDCTLLDGSGKYKFIKRIIAGVLRIFAPLM